MLLSRRDLSRVTTERRHRDSHSNFSIALYYNIIEHSLNEAPEAGTDVMIFA